jgi:hypothetical protein
VPYQHALYRQQAGKAAGVQEDGLWDSYQKPIIVLHVDPLTGLLPKMLED